MPSLRRKQNPKSFQRPNTRGVKGWVYVITNAGMPGLVKVGFTMKDPDERARELAHTGNPHPYAVDYQVWVEDPYSVEQQAQRKLTSSGYRVGEDRFSGAGIEWFSCKIEQAIVAIRHATGGEYAHETFRRAEREIVEATVRKEKAGKRAREHVAQLNARMEKEFKSAVYDSFPPRPYWQYFLVCYLGSVAILTIVFSRLTDGQVLFGSLFFGGIVAFVWQVMWEDRHLTSRAYLEMKQRHERDCENAQFHFFNCPHCSSMMKIDYVQSFVEGSKIMFHCESCGRDVANPLVASSRLWTTETGSGAEDNPVPVAEQGLTQTSRDQVKGKTFSEAIRPADNAVLDMIESSLKRSEQVGHPHQSNVGEDRAYGARLESMLPRGDNAAANCSPLRSALLRVWDSDAGNNTLRQELWHSFQAGLGVELSTRVDLTEAQKERIARASNRIWENRSATYQKALWRELDDAIASALPRDSWVGR